VASPAASTVASTPVPPFPAFAAFSPDGRTFVWLSTRGSNPAHKLRKQISVGEDDPKRLAFEGEYETVSGELTNQGWSPERRPPPADLNLEAHLGAKPPKVVLERNGKTVDLAVGKLPYAAGEVAEIWGASRDGRHVVVHIAGGNHHNAFVARVP
jgi:hypothetical protein